MKKYKTRYIEHADGRLQKADDRSKTDQPPRRKRATGPGSLDCEQQVMALAELGRVDDALALYDKHCAMRGVRPSGRLTTWAFYARREQAAASAA